MARFIALLFLPLLILNFSTSGAATRDDREDHLDDVAEAVGHELVPPFSALISPTGARLQVAQKAKVLHDNGHSVIEFIIPPDSGNLQLSIPGHAIVRWSSTPAMLDSNSAIAGRRAIMEKERIHINAHLMTVNSRLALWQALPKSTNAQEMTQLQAAMQTAMPALALEQAELERRLKLVNEELSRIPAASSIGERIRVVLAENLPENTPVDLFYSYTHDGCGWEAIYDFNARSDEGSGDMIDVRLLAEVWQFTGMDWKDTHIVLSTHGYGPREPRPLQKWVIDSEERPAPQPRAANAPAVLSSASAHKEAASADMAPVLVNTDTVYATWQLSATGLPQGRARMQISAAAWQAPLQWLARPSTENTQVWLLATYTLPPDQAWPQGQAEYSLNGQSVGSGIFRPRSGEATLYFGADPRVNVKTVVNSRNRSQSGFINTSRNWTWSWTYIITNMHNKPIKVKVERPIPMIVDENVTVAYQNKPQAVTDAGEHMQYWDMDVPANGKATIDHEVTVSSPTRLPFLPDVP